MTAPKPSAGANNPTASKPATATHASIQPYILMIPPIGMGMGVPMIGAYPRMVHSRGYGYYGYRYRRNHYNRGYSGYNRSNALQAARLRHLQKLVADLDSLSPGASVPASAGNTLRTDLLALAQGGYHPSRDSALAVSTALISTLPQRKHNLLDTMRLASDLEAVVNAGNVSPEGINEAILDAETVLKDGGVARPGIQTVATALHTLGGLGLRAVR